MLAISGQKRGDAPDWGMMQDNLNMRRSVVRRQLLALSRALRSGDTRRLHQHSDEEMSHLPGPVAGTGLSYEFQGAYWLAQRLTEQVGRMRTQVAAPDLK